MFGLLVCSWSSQATATEECKKNCETLWQTEAFKCIDEFDPSPQDAPYTSKEECRDAQVKQMKYCTLRCDKQAQLNALKSMPSGDLGALKKEAGN